MSPRRAAIWLGPLVIVGLGLTVTVLFRSPPVVHHSPPHRHTHLASPPRRSPVPVAATPVPSDEPTEPKKTVAAALFDRAPTIFVSMAAFRDNEAAQTLSDMFAQAAVPSRIFVGVMCQRDMNLAEEHCLPQDEWYNCSTSEFCPSDQIRVRDISYKEARGPTYARYLASTMYRGEDFFLMIDAHNKFLRHWDQKLLDMHKKCSKDSAKCILSVYPMAWDKKDTTPLEGRKSVAFLCGNARWHHGGYPGPFSGSVYGLSSEARPQPFVGAGLVFGRGTMLDEVPFDPHLPFLFHGEEILLTVRLWTAGYDFFSPGDNVLYHHYYRSGRPRMESLPGWGRYAALAVKRVQYILNITRDGNRVVTEENAPEEVLRDLDRYGLGAVRPLERYWRFSRIDIVGRRHDECNKHWCARYSGHPPYSDEWKAAANTDLPPTAPVPPTCSDDYPDCPEWQQRGECSKNPGMLDFCKRSCKQC